MKELTFEEFCELPMTYTLGMCGDSVAQRAYRNNDIGLQREVITERKRRGDIYSGWRDGEVYYYLDGDTNEYRTPDQVYVAYMARVCGVTGDDVRRMK